MPRSNRSSPTTSDHGAEVVRDAGGNAWLAAALGTVRQAGFDGPLAAAVAAAPTGVVITDPNLPDNPIIFCNPGFTAITGYEPEEILGRNCRFLQGTGSEPEALMAIRRALAAGEPITINLTNRRRDGRRFSNELRLAPVRDAEGRLTAFVGVQNDISPTVRAAAATERARAVSERASREKTDFLTFVSHEIRTPLAGLIGSLSLLRDTVLNAEQSAYSETATAAGDMLLSRVNELLDISLIESGRLSLAQEPFALADALRGTMELIAPAVEEKGLALSVTIDSGLPARVVGDADRLGQVILNLAENAVSFTERGSILIHVTSLPDARIGIAVTDTGSGMPAAQRQALVAGKGPFALPGGQGVGIGLTTCHRLVKLMGGRLAIDSKPGKGSTFFFDIPLVPVADSGKPPRKVTLAPAVPVAGVRGRILLAEEGAVNQLVAAAILRREGYQVETVHDGAEALAAARVSEFDLLLVDFALPGMDGLTLTRRVRALPGERGRVPIVALTAFAMPADVAAALAAGMDAHLAKPLERRALLAAVEAVLLTPPLRARARPPATEPGAPAVLVDRVTLAELRQAIGPGRLPKLLTLFAEETRGRVALLPDVPSERAVREVSALRDAASTFGTVALRDAATALLAVLTAGDDAAAAPLMAALPALAERSIAALPSPLLRMV
ncbi:response regulator [Rhodovarius crocodyli]|uniref:histidine kinase n=1 Tax=Rhodovarius crocodyli TaxID=1979269 RepID=A0A437LZ76_9PROT|nr:response regulator [Rhodovarius crocodyli]RVT90702.1 response regulator [Rhodovarius crocodyli]